MTNESFQVATDVPLFFETLTSEADFMGVLETLRGIHFGYGAISTNPNLPIWRGEVPETSLPVRLALDAICRRSTLNFVLVSCHLNLQTHGLDGAFHVDFGDPNGVVTHALNWYVHPYDWLVEYGGYLLVGDDHHNLRAVLPSRNSAVLLPAGILHCAMSPTLRAGARARVSLTLKLRLEDEISD